MKTKTESFLQKGEIVSYTSGTKEAAEKGKPAHNLKKVALKLGIVTLAFSMALTGCSKSEAENNQQQTTQNQQISKEQAIEAARQEFLTDDKGVGFNDRDKEYLNRLFDYLVYTQEIRDLQQADKKVPKELKEKQTEALEGISLYIKNGDVIDVRFKILDEEGSYNAERFAKELRDMLIERLLSDSFRTKTIASQNTVKSIQQEAKEKVRE